MRLWLWLALSLVVGAAGCSVDRIFANGTGGAGGAGQGGGGNGGTGGAQMCMQGGDCASGFCADGFCCDKKCSGACGACNVPGQEGTCDSTCKDGFACGKSGCLTSCSRPEDCANFFTCKDSKCERMPEGDCLDGKDNNGDGLVDCDDPTCDALVQCVDEAPADGELGLHITSGTCPADYDDAHPFHSGLISGTCTGCTCQTQCTVAYDLFNSTDCSLPSTHFEIMGPPDFSLACHPFGLGSFFFNSGTRSAASTAGCKPDGQATFGPDTWMTDDTFCTAKTSPSCKGKPHQICVAKPPASDPLCVRVDKQASCPIAYQGGEDAIFHTDGDIDEGHCDACADCAPSPTMTCVAVPITTQLLTSSMCNGGSGVLLDTTCGTINPAVSYDSAEVKFDHSGMDTCTPGGATTPSVVTGGTRFCCKAN